MFESRKVSMKIRKLLFALLIPFLGAGGVFAQQGLHLSQMSDRIWAQRYQPAHLLEGDYTTFRYGAKGGFLLGNSQANLDGLLVKGGFITDETKDRIIGQLGKGEVLYGGYHLGVAAVNFKLGNQPVGVYIDQRADVTAGFNDPVTFGLLTKGNAPYAGDTVGDQDVFARLYSSRKIGFGTAWEFGKLKLGVRANFISGIRMANLSHLNYSLYTHPDGIELDLQADYSLTTTPKLTDTKLFEMQGIGGSVEIGASYALSEKITLDAAILDLGMTSWKTEKIEDNLDINWEGIFITSIFQDSIPETIEAEVDSLRELIFPDTVAGSTSVISPASFRLGMTMKIGEKGQFGAMLMYNPTRSGAYTRMPLLNIRYQHEVIDGLRLAANAYGGGTDSYGFGLMAAYRIPIKEWAIDLTIGGENVLGYVAPSLGRGFGFFGGLGVQL